MAGVTKELTLKLNTITEPAKTPGKVNGSKMEKKVLKELAPRFCEALMTEGSIFRVSP